MAAAVNRARPQRWKIFQVLALEGENAGAGALTDVAPVLVERADFDAFVSRNAAVLDDPRILKVEPNDIMQSSYLLVDEEGRFLDASSGKKQPSPSSILAVGAHRALAEMFQRGASFDHAAFAARDGAFFLGGAAPTPPAPAPAPAPAPTATRCSWSETACGWRGVGARVQQAGQARR